MALQVVTMKQGESEEIFIIKLELSIICIRVMWIRRFRYTYTDPWEHIHRHTHKIEVCSKYSN